MAGEFIVSYAWKFFFFLTRTFQYWWQQMPDGDITKLDDYRLQATIDNRGPKKIKLTGYTIIFPKGMLVFNDSETGVERINLDVIIEPGKNYIRAIPLTPRVPDKITVRCFWRIASGGPEKHIDIDWP